MNIIVRCCGERTESRCVHEAQKQGNIYIVREVPFGESIKKTYELALNFNQAWIPVIDADVLLYPNTIKSGINILNRLNEKSIFCLDGKTKDKIFISNRRAGIHIYNRVLLSKALKYIDNNKIQPESHVRKSMDKIGYLTISPNIIFGVHDYEQYYCDLWRKAFVQTQKLKGRLKKKNMNAKWNKLSKTDKDYIVILAAHKAGLQYKDNMIIDKRITYGAEENIKILGLKEKMRWDEILKRLPENAVMAEIGVWKGGNACNILSKNNTVKMYLIDRWCIYTIEEIEREGYTKVPQSSRDKFKLVKKQTYAKMKEFSDRVKIYDMDSVKASKLFKDNFFDLVFIDALHSYKGCLADVRNWISKVKKGGYIGGHDITRIGVIKAVKEMFGDNYELGIDKTWWHKI